MKLIVGLGNPSRTYRDSRHNIGFLIVKALSKSYKIALKKESNICSLSGRGMIQGRDVILALPLTFMNACGTAVAGLLRKYRLKPQDSLIVCDDLDLAFGRLKIKAAGSSAGHRGLKSILQAGKGDNFPRMRMGIGRPVKGVDPAEYVLSAFTAQEKKKLANLIAKACACCSSWVRKGITETMNIFNRRDVLRI